MTSDEPLKKVKWLSRYRILENQIKRLEAEKERWENRSTNTVPAPVHFKYITKKDKLEAITKDERRRNEMAPVIIRDGNSIGIDDVAAEICELEDAIQKKIDQARKVRCEIGKAIDSVEDDRLQLVLYYRYVDGMYLEEICVKMKYSYPHIKRIHNEALASL